MSAPMASVVPGADRRIARTSTGLLRLFNAAGVLGPADVHTSDRVSSICRDTGEQVRLALALTVRALRTGSVCIDLDTIAQNAFDEAAVDEAGEPIDLTALPWPDPVGWRAVCERSPLVTLGEDAPGERPLRMVHGQLYLERYWAQEEQVRTELVGRRAAPPPHVDLPRLTAGLDRIYGPRPAGAPDLQRLAAAASVTNRVTVLAGGPGTGKTTTVARLLSLVTEQQPGARIALAAPTGKAAARLEEAVRDAARDLPPSDAARIGTVEARTLHRLLGPLPGRSNRFRYDAENHLPYDLVVVDEMSMVPLTMMARLLAAVRPDARLVLVGDPDQLSSVDAGAVMADVTGAELPDRAEVRGALERVGAPGADARATHGVVQLTHVYRFGERIGALAAAIRDGDPDRVVELLHAPAGTGADQVLFTDLDLSVASPDLVAQATAGLRAEVVAAAEALNAGAADGDAQRALAGLDEHRLLCAHRLGPYGEARWSREVEGWLADAFDGYGVPDRPGSEWYVGRPVIKTVNDYDVELYNGDTGVAIATPQGLRVAFARGGEPVLIAPVRLDQLQTVHAMTVHRAQGSQFRQVSFILPPPGSPLLTRELLYTAVTRASDVVRIIGSVESIRRAVVRPAARASGLRRRLAEQRTPVGPVGLVGPVGPARD